TPSAAPLGPEWGTPAPVDTGAVTDLGKIKSVAALRKFGSLRSDPNGRQKNGSAYGWIFTNDSGTTVIFTAPAGIKEVHWWDGDRKRVMKSRAGQRVRVKPGEQCSAWHKRPVKL
ncbi:hypothetical protein IJJ12_01410, partial [bacterium]|nr:hypothetical protein [bacterium]